MIKKDKEVVLSDSAKGALALNNSFGKNKLPILTESEHGKILTKNGFIRDLEFCSNENINSVIPYYTNSVLKALG
jgi:phosphosulfolactate phosphohydrolase-like enzyme